MGELIHDFGEVIEGVIELVDWWCRAVTITRVVGSDDVVAIGESRHKVAKHLRRGREAVQQEQRRIFPRASLAIEDVQLSTLTVLYETCVSV
jgi:hypothetical protein